MKSSFTFLLLILICFQAFSQVKEGVTDKKNFVIPRYFIAKSEAYIKGPFDGDGSNTYIRFENNRTQSFDVKPIMESKEKILIKIPETYGEFELIIADEGSRKVLFEPVNVIHLKTEYEDFSLTKKRSKFYAKFLGAELIEDAFSFRITNKSPHVINIIGGNNQKATVKSTKNGEEVVWEGEMLRLMKRESEFLIIFTLDQPKSDIEIPAE